MYLEYENRARQAQLALENTLVEVSQCEYISNAP